MYSDINNPPKKLYCTECGLLMDKCESIKRYNEETGEPIYLTTFTCPKKSWWNRKHSCIKYIGKIRLYNFYGASL